MNEKPYKKVFDIKINQLEVQQSASGTINGLDWKATIKNTLPSRRIGIWNISISSKGKERAEDWDNFKYAKNQIGISISKAEKAIALEKARKANA